MIFASAFMSCTSESFEKTDVESSEDLIAIFKEGVEAETKNLPLKNNITIDDTYPFSGFEILPLQPNCVGSNVSPTLLDPGFKSSTYNSQVPLVWNIGNTGNPGDFAFEVENSIKGNGRYFLQSPTYPGFEFILKDDNPLGITYDRSSWHHIFFEENAWIGNFDPQVGTYYTHYYLSDTPSNDSVHSVTRDILKKLMDYREELNQLHSQKFYFYNISVIGNALLCTNSTARIMSVNFDIGYLAQ
jgi:hypothetical protein